MFRVHFGCLKISFIIVILVILLSFPGQPLTSIQKSSSTEQTDYVNMTRILFSYEPGIDYTSLHNEYRRKNPETSFIWDFSYTLPVIPRRADSFLDSDTSIKNVSDAREAHFGSAF